MGDVLSPPGSHLPVLGSLPALSEPCIPLTAGVAEGSHPLQSFFRPHGCAVPGSALKHRVLSPSEVSLTLEED